MCKNNPGDAIRLWQMILSIAYLKCMQQSVFGLQSNADMAVASSSFHQLATVGNMRAGNKT